MAQGGGRLLRCSTWTNCFTSYYFDVKRTESDKEPKSRDLKFDLAFETKDVLLTEEQNEVYEKIKAHSETYYPVLLHGITGSGKTEIYINLIKDALRDGKSALFLVPEIGLTPQMLARLNHHFKGKLLVYHSGLSKNQQLNQWKACLDNEPKVMVGTRSALFAPFENLGLVIVDEEHDTSYKQEDRFRYNARDLAVMRAHLLKIPVILGSATPSLESYHQAQEKKYHYFELKQRVGGAKLPDMRIIDFQKEKEQRGLPLLLSQSIHDAIDHYYEKREQMILFVGQRGFAQNAYCLSCASIQICPNCSVGLTYHKYKNELKCHYCDYAFTFDQVCRGCKEKSLTLLGFGTQSIEEEILSMHPKLIVTRVDSDSMNTPAKMQQAFEDFANAKTNLLIGTQMLSKGHDFSHVGFVGIVGVDAHMGLPDFRAGERAFQNLVQVAGRAGRSDKKGKVIVQSLSPKHPLIKFAQEQDYKSFAEWELQQREALLYPPFSRLIQIRFLANDEKRLKSFVSQWQRFLEVVRNKSNDSMQILGPCEMPLAKVRGKHRYHIILKVKRGLRFQDMLVYLTQDLKERKLVGIQFQIDVDSMSLI